eukprot:scpid34100/ scgid2149/ 
MNQPCRGFRPHPWRKGICIDCFCQENTHVFELSRKSVGSAFEHESRTGVGGRRCGRLSRGDIDKSTTPDLSPKKLSASSPVSARIQALRKINESSQVSSTFTYERPLRRKTDTESGYDTVPTTRHSSADGVEPQQPSSLPAEVLSTFDCGPSPPRGSSVVGHVLPTPTDFSIDGNPVVLVNRTSLLSVGSSANDAGEAVDSKSGDGGDVKCEQQLQQSPSTSSLCSSKYVEATGTCPRPCLLALRSDSFTSTGADTTMSPASSLSHASSPRAFSVPFTSSFHLLGKVPPFRPSVSSGMSTPSSEPSTPEKHPASSRQRSAEQRLLCSSNPSGLHAHQERESLGDSNESGIHRSGPCMNVACTPLSRAESSSSKAKYAGGSTADVSRTASASDTCIDDPKHGEEDSLDTLGGTDEPRHSLPGDPLKPTFKKVIRMVFNRNRSREIIKLMKPKASNSVDGSSVSINLPPTLTEPSPSHDVMLGPYTSRPTSPPSSTPSPETPRSRSRPSLWRSHRGHAFRFKGSSKDQSLQSEEGMPDFYPSSSAPCAASNTTPKLTMLALMHRVSTDSTCSSAAEQMEQFSTRDNQISSIQEGLASMWRNASHLVWKRMPANIAKSVSDWKHLKLIGHTDGQFPTTLLTHFEHCRDGTATRFSMEIEMMVTLKRSKSAEVARDATIREVMTPHFNILRPCGKVIQRLPLEIECKMDMATSDCLSHACFITDSMHNYVGGYEYVAENLSGKRLKDKEECITLLLLQLLLALEHAQSFGIVHRHIDLDKMMIGPVDGLSGDRLLLAGFEYALSAASDKKTKVESTKNPPPEWFVYDVNDLMYLGCNINHLPPEIIGLCDSSPQLDFSCVDAYAVGVFLSELLEVFDGDHPSFLHYICKALMVPAPSIRLSLTRTRRLIECWLWGPRAWLRQVEPAGQESPVLSDVSIDNKPSFNQHADKVNFTRDAVKKWIARRQTGLLSSVALSGMVGGLSVADLLQCRFLSTVRPSELLYSGQWFNNLVRSRKI